MANSITAPKWRRNWRRFPRQFGYGSAGRGIAKFGIDGALTRANGIFAFAAFDRATRTLHLARDRLGVKPLYWTRQNRCFAFASELKALRPVAGLAFEIDPGAVSSFLRHAYVPAPASIFAGVEKLQPAIGSK